MKIAEVRKLKFDSPYPELLEVSERMDKIGKRLLIDKINWKDYDYKPEVKVSVAYTDNELLLKYYISENYFKAEKTDTNQMVCEDSCVEFFVSPEDDGIYYNLEFNGIGTCLMGSGTKRETNKRMEPNIVKKIRRITSVGNDPVKEKTGKFDWNITIAIPFEVFFHHKVKELKGKSFKANFYKCGDELEVPHYLTWNSVGTGKPDYHQPDYFGLLMFV